MYKLQFQFSLVCVGWLKLWGARWRPRHSQFRLITHTCCPGGSTDLVTVQASGHSAQRRELAANHSSQRRPGQWWFGEGTFHPERRPGLCGKTLPTTGTVWYTANNTFTPTTNPNVPFSAYCTSGVVVGTAVDGSERRGEVQRYPKCNNRCEWYGAAGCNRQGGNPVNHLSLRFDGPQSSKRRQRCRPRICL